MSRVDTASKRLRVGMVGLGMIFDETYRPAFIQLRDRGLFRRETGLVEVELAAAASRTGNRAERVSGVSQLASGVSRRSTTFAGPNAVRDLLNHGVDALCIATPDDRHYPAAKAALEAGKHVLIEKPSVLRVREWEELTRLAERNGVLAKVVYHKLLDPDHKRLRTLVADGVLNHVNHGYCSLLEPKQVSGSQFAEWIGGRNPGTYVAVHYAKLIDFTFFTPPTSPLSPSGGEGSGVRDARLHAVLATGQRGIVGPANGPTWDSVQLRLVYRCPDDREAAFDIHTSWVAPDNFPGYVEQEVQFRFDNGVWNASQRKRGVELTVEGRTPYELKTMPNHHYNAEFLEPWGERRQRGYGIEAITRFFEEVSLVEFGGPPAARDQRLRQMRALAYNDLSADRNVVAVVEAMESLLAKQATGEAEYVVRFE